MSLVQNIRVGELNEFIQLEKEVYTDDGMGGSTSSWELQGEYRAQVRALSGRERQNNDTLQAEGGYRIVMWNIPDLDVNASWRVLWRNRYLNIRHVEYNGPQDLYLVMQSDAGVAT